jgi:hypothetical protein
VRDQDRACTAGKRTGDVAGLAGQNLHHPLDDLQDIALALAQVGIVDGIELVEQQVELQLKDRETKVKEDNLKIQQQKVLVGAAAEKDKLDIERERIASQERIAGLQVGAKVATAKGQLESKDKLEGMRLGVDVAKETEAMRERKQPVAPQTEPAKEKTDEQ